MALRIGSARGVGAWSAIVRQATARRHFASDRFFDPELPHKVRPNMHEASEEEDEDSAAGMSRGFYVPDKVKQQMWQFHKRNPAYWTTGRLAGKFGVKRSRAYAILLLKEREEKMREEGMFNSVIEDMLYEQFGNHYEVEKPEVDLPSNMVTEPVPDHEFIDEHFSPEKFPLRRLQFRSRVLRRTVHDPAPKMLNPCSAPAHLQRWKIGVKDISDPHEDKLMLIKDSDGALRPSTYDEEVKRTWVRKQAYRPPLTTSVSP